MDIPLHFSSLGASFASDLIQEEKLQQEMIAAALSHEKKIVADIVSQNANFDVDAVRWSMDLNDLVVSAV